MRFLQRRFERVLEYFVQGDLDRKMKRMSVAILVLIALGGVGIVWAANSKIQNIPVWRVLLNRK